MFIIFYNFLYSIIIGTFDKMGKIVMKNIIVVNWLDLTLKMWQKCKLLYKVNFIQENKTTLQLFPALEILINKM